MRASTLSSSASAGRSRRPSPLARTRARTASEHRLDLRGHLPVADRPPEPVGDRVERDGPDREAQGGPALDRLHLDGQHPLVGRRQGRGPDLAGGDEAAQGLVHVRLGGELAGGPDLLGRGLDVGPGLRPGEGRGVHRPVLGREREVPELALGRAVEAGDPGTPEADHVPVDRLGAAVRVGQPLAARAHPGAGHLERRVVERRQRPGRHRRVVLDRGEPRRERQPLAPVREGRVEQAQALAGGEVEQPVPAARVGPLDPQDAERGPPQGRQGGALVGVGRPVLAGEAVDRGRARGRGANRATSSASARASPIAKAATSSSSSAIRPSASQWRAVSSTLAWATNGSAARRRSAMIPRRTSARSSGREAPAGGRLSAAARAIAPPFGLPGRRPALPGRPRAEPPPAGIVSFGSTRTERRRRTRNTVR